MDYIRSFIRPVQSTAFLILLEFLCFFQYPITSGYQKFLRGLGIQEVTSQKREPAQEFLITRGAIHGEHNKRKINPDEPSGHLLTWLRHGDGYLSRTVSCLDPYFKTYFSVTQLEQHIFRLYSSVKLFCRNI